MSVDGPITTRSGFGPDETMKRLDAAVRARGMTVFALVDHAAGAASAGLPLRPTAVILFGNPRGGTPLMQSAQTCGIELPLKALVWQDAAGETWLSCNDPAWIARRHDPHHGTDAAVRALGDALREIAAAATGPAPAG